jgi:cyanophycinase-like exopeptidase
MAREGEIMDELHAAIAAYLREECQRDIVKHAEGRTFFCRFCGEPYCTGGDDFHLNELIAAGACLDCHRTRLRREAQIGGTSVAQRAYTAEVVPHCRACGEPITDEDGPFALADMQLRRQCATHYYRAVRAR